MKTGDLVFVRTTEEPVHVLAVDYIGVDMGYPHYKLGKDATVMVRRPVQSHEHGISHTISFFLPEELETNEERARRRLEEGEMVQRLMQGAAQHSPELDDLDVESAVKN